MDKNFEDFKKEINLIVERDWTKLMLKIDESGIKVSLIDFAVNLDEEVLVKFGLNNDILILCSATPQGMKIKYYYKFLELNPDCYYVRPVNYNEVSTLTILHEAIRQDKYNPDIKHLEKGVDNGEKNKSTKSNILK